MSATPNGTGAHTLAAGHQAMQDSRTSESEVGYAAWATWHARRESALAAPYGWLSQTGLYWLNALNGHSLSIPGIPGIWEQRNNAVWFIPSQAQTSQTSREESSWLVSGERRTPVTDATAVASDADQEPTHIEYDGLRAFVIERDGAFAIRVRDPNSQSRLQFSGVPVFPFTPSWAVEARFIPFASRKDTTVGTHTAGLNSTIPAVGEIVLRLAGEPQRLLAFDGGGDDEGNRELFLIFRDATNGSTTYASGRFLNIALPQQFRNDDGEVAITLDFNRAVNPPCALSPYCTCPLAPAQNVIPVAVTAGERIGSPSAPDGRS